MIDRKLRAEISSYSKLLHEMRFVANHDGNVSARVEGNRFLCTPTAVSKRLIDEEDVIMVDEAGKKVSGKGNPFSEMGLHLAAYLSRPEVMAVVHAHPPFATAFGVSGEALSPVFLPEAVVSLGLEVPLVPLAQPGEKAVSALKSVIHRADAFLLSGNGVIAVGVDLEQAYLRLELVEHLCRIASYAKPLGGPKALPQEMITSLLESRKKAGLGPKNAVASVAPTAKSETTPKTKPADDLRRLIAEEVVKALQSSK
jgi:L-fuculose-phosphate aldolase